MPVARLIYVNVEPAQASEAERIWKEDCAPLMISEDGCLSEELLKCKDSPGEYISYSEWRDDRAVSRYEDSNAHREIEEHTKHLQVKGAPVTKRYEVAG